MFGFSSKDKKDKNSDKQAGSNRDSVGNANQRPDRGELQARALASMQAAKDNLGQDTINKIAESIKKMEQTNAKLAAARRQIAEEADAAVVAHELLSMIKDGKK